MNHGIEKKLAENVLFSIFEETKKKYVKEYFEDYLNYINKDKENINRGLLRKVENKYKEYMKNEI